MVHHLANCLSRAQSRRQKLRNVPLISHSGNDLHYDYLLLFLLKPSTHIPSISSRPASLSHTCTAPLHTHRSSLSHPLSHTYYREHTHTHTHTLIHSFFTSIIHQFLHHVTSIFVCVAFRFFDHSLKRERGHDLFKNQQERDDLFKNQQHREMTYSKTSNTER